MRDKQLSGSGGDKIMLDNKGFDLWADGYDRTVGVSDDENSYPFAGYKEVLAKIYGTIMSRAEAKKEKTAVLDIGFGTGTLAAKLYENGCEVFGQDFSENMIKIAQEKMPEAHLYRGDFSQKLAEPLLGRSYDFITATYSLHHLTDAEKTAFIGVLSGLLRDGGMLLIGDVAFEDREKLNRCREEVSDEWDDEEIYFVADEIKKSFPGMKFEKVSYCAGILTLLK